MRIGQRQPGYNFPVERVSGAVSRDVALYVATDKRQIANTVEYFVPRTLIGNTQLIVDDSVSTEHEKIFGRRSRTVAFFAQCLDFRLEDERACERKFIYECLRRNFDRATLPLYW